MSIETAQPLLADKYYRWVVVAYGVIVQAVSVGTLIYCFALFSLPWLEEFSSSRRDLMLTIALMQIGVGVVSPFVGRALDAYPTQWVVTTGLASLVTRLNPSPTCHLAISIMVGLRHIYASGYGTNGLACCTNL